MILNIFWSYTIFDGKKCYFGILDNLCARHKVVLWFGEGRKFLFLSCLLPPVCFVPEAVIQIKHFAT